MKILDITPLDPQELRYIELLEQDLDTAKKSVSRAESVIRENFYNLRTKYFPEMKSVSPNVMGAIPTLEIHAKHLVVVRHDY